MPRDAVPGQILFSCNNGQAVSFEAALFNSIFVSNAKKKHSFFVHFKGCKNMATGIYYP